MIVSPTTLLATLRVIDSLWRQERQSQNAREIAEKAGALYDKFVAFIRDLDEIGNRLQQVDRAYLLRATSSATGVATGRPRRAVEVLGARASKRLPGDWLERAGAEAFSEAGE